MSRTEVGKPMKKQILLSTLADLHVAYVGNGASINEVARATLRVRNLDATMIRFGETFEKTRMLNSVEYEILDDSNLDKWPIEGLIADPAMDRLNGPALASKGAK